MTQPHVRTVVLDSEALSELICGNKAVLAFVKAATDLGGQVVFPTITLAELMTGNPSDAKIWRVVNRLGDVDLTTTIAAQAGHLRERAETHRRKKRDLTVDAVVAATAISLAPSVIITSDPRDLTLLTESFDVRIEST